MIGEKSIFEAYKRVVDEYEGHFEDIIIFCHDDIRILTDPEVFTQLIEKKLSDKYIGFVGVAGTSYLTKTGVWWEQEPWSKGLHSGSVWHGELENCVHTYYGEYKNVVCLDGLFLAAKVRTLRNINLNKLNTFPGDWEFYDILYTIRAFQKKLKNVTLPIQIIHQSFGDLAGRDSWHLNREAFLQWCATNRLLPAKA